MKGMRKVAIVAACRTPIGAFGGSLKSVIGAQLAATVIREILNRTKIDPSIIGDVRFGCCMDHYDAINVARVAGLLAGVPDTVPGVTMNRVCVSAMEAIQSGYLNIATGFADVIVAGGVESMSNAPYMVPNARWGKRLQDDSLVCFQKFYCEKIVLFVQLDAMIHGLMVGSTVIPYPKDGPIKMMRGQPYIMGLTAEFLAHKHRISREEQDEIALRSHNNVERVTKSGILRECGEIVPVEVKQKKKVTIIDKDEHFRPGLTMAQLEKLPPAFIPDWRFFCFFFLFTPISQFPILKISAPMLEQSLLGILLESTMEPLLYCWCVFTSHISLLIFHFIRWNWRKRRLWV